MKKTFLLMLVVFLFNTVCLAKTKVIIKEASEVIPQNQSQEQFIEELKQTLRKQATEDAGEFIKNEFKLDNYQISKEEFASFADLIADVNTEKEEIITKNKKKYAKVKISFTVDTNSMQNLLTNMTAINNEDMTEINKQIEENNLIMQQNIEQENESISKIELEIQYKMEELKLKAKENMLKWNPDITYVQEAINEATITKKETFDLLENLKLLLKDNRTRISNFYDKQIQVKCKNLKKDALETKFEFNERVKNSKQIEQNLKKEKENAIFNNENKTLDSMLTIIIPFIKQLNHFQKGKFYDNSYTPAEIDSLGEINLNEQFFVINIKYMNKIYTLHYSFSDIGKDIAKLMYNTKQQFKIEPLFSVNDLLEKELTAFNIKHERTYIEQTINLDTTIKPFNEIYEFRSIYGINLLNKKLTAKINEFKKDKNLSKFTVIIDNLEKIKNSSNRDKERTYKQINRYLKGLEDLVIKIAVGDKHTVGLRKNGTVIACGNNDFAQCNVQDWKDIKEIAAGKIHTVGLKKDGTVVVASLNIYGEKNTKIWEDIIAVSAGGLHTVGLKDNGTVVACGQNNYAQCNIQDWQHIKAICAGGLHTVGLKDNGMVVAFGNNEFGQCDVHSWRNIVAISAGETYTLGVKEDGTKVICGHYYKSTIKTTKDIVEIAVDKNHTAGLKSNGTVIAAGENEDGQCNVKDWDFCKDKKTRSMLFIK